MNQENYQSQSEKPIQSPQPQKPLLAGWIVLIVIVCLLLGGVGGYYYFQSQEKETPVALTPTQAQTAITPTTTPTSTPTATTTDETADWETYKSKNYGYSIKFPKDLYYKGDKVQSYPGEFGAQDLIISDIEKMGIQDIMANEKIHITIATIKKPSDQSFYDYVKNNIGDSEISEIEIGGKEAYKINYSTTNHPNINIHANNDDIIYFINGTNYLGESIDSENFQLMQKIIDTFKFTQ